MKIEELNIYLMSSYLLGEHVSILEVALTLESDWESEIDSSFFDYYGLEYPFDVETVKLVKKYVGILQGKFHEFEHLSNFSRSEYRSAIRKTLRYIDFIFENNLQYVLEKDECLMDPGENEIYFSLDGLKRFAPTLIDVEEDEKIFFKTMERLNRIHKTLVDVRTSVGSEGPTEGRDIYGVLEELFLGNRICFVSRTQMFDLIQNKYGIDDLNREKLDMALRKFFETGRKPYKMKATNTFKDEKSTLPTNVIGYVRNDIKGRVKSDYWSLSNSPAYLGITLPFEDF
jgi:hypothetical protein